MATDYRTMLGLSYSNPRKLGAQFGAGTSAERLYRGKLLAQLIQQGKIKTSDLSSQDLAIATPRLGEVRPGGGGSSIFGKVGGFFGNLGEDIVDATKGLPAGAVNIGQSAYNDVLDLISPGTVRGGAYVHGDRGEPGSDIKARVVDPTIQAYKYTYGGVGAPEGSSLLGRIYQHPLGPILDAASAVSLGVGAAARGTALASKAGVGVAQPGRALHNALLSTERAPIVPGKLPESHVAEGETVPSYPREYSTRPLRRALQYGTDKISDIPFLGKPVASAQERLTRTQKQRGDFSIKELQGNVLASREGVEPLVPLLKDMTPDEVAAVPLIGMRFNTPELLDLYQQAVREGIKGEGPEGQNVPSAITPELPESRANLSERTKELATDPAKSPALMNFLNTYTERLQSRVYPDIGEDKVQEFVDMPRKSLLERFGRDEPQTNTAGVPSVDLSGPEGFNQLRREVMQRARNRRAEEAWGPADKPPFEGGFLVPTQVSQDVRYSDPGRIGRMLGRKPGLELGRRRTFNVGNVGIQDIFRSPYMAGRPDVDAILAGVVRPDPRQFVDFLTKHERDRVERDFNEQLVYENAVKDEAGNPVKVPGNWSPEKVQQEFGADFVPVNPDIPWHFYNKEFTVGQAAAKMEAAGLDMSEVMARMAQEGEDFSIDSTLAAQRTPNVVVPKKFGEYQLALAQAHLPYKLAAGRVAARAMNFWRTHTLTYMPRWALNTAVGSFVLATVKGISPRQYYIAQRLRSTVDDVTKARLRPGEKGFFDQPEMAGVNLASIASWDMLEMGALGHADAMNMKTGMISRQVMRRVQQIEDHFRRASFVQSLDQRARQVMNEQGAILRNVEASRGPRTTEEYAAYIAENPEMVRKAVDDLNKFSYNFATLGPAERRYIRQAIPFWGWYKFISGLAYRLPIDYPARTMVMTNLGYLGTTAVDAGYGDMPAWLKGAIPLSPGAKNFSYLSTMGLNPFSQILNPVGPEGPVAGTLQLGQASPLIQSLLVGYGLDPLRGGEVPISPQTMSEAGVGKGIFGTMVDVVSGEEKDPAQVGAGRRVLANLIRSFPYARIAERQQAGGRSSFPESLPWAPRPMPTKPESRFGGAGSEVLEQLLGVAPRPYDLKAWQSLAKKQGRYAKTRNRTDLRKLRKNLRTP